MSGSKAETAWYGLKKRYGKRKPLSHRQAGRGGIQGREGEERRGERESERQTDRHSDKNKSSQVPPPGTHPSD